MSDAAHPAPSGAIIILFTDLVSSTDLLSRLGDEAMEKVRKTHFQLLRQAVSEFRGVEVKNLGDGLMVVFNSALGAVACATAMQQNVSAHNASHAEEPLAVRVGLHAGEPFVDEGGSDYFGTPVVVAKRLCDAAQGGQILVSDLVANLVGTRGAVRFRARPPAKLKGLPEPLPCYEVVWGEGVPIHVEAPRPKAPRKRLLLLVLGLAFMVAGLYVTFEELRRPVPPAPTPTTVQPEPTTTPTPPVTVVTPAPTPTAETQTPEAASAPAPSPPAEKPEPGTSTPDVASEGTPGNAVAPQPEPPLPTAASLQATWEDRWNEGEKRYFFTLIFRPGGTGEALGNYPRGRWQNPIRWTYTAPQLSVIFGEDSMGTISYHVDALENDMLTVTALTGENAGETSFFTKRSE